MSQLLRKALEKHDIFNENAAMEQLQLTDCNSSEPTRHKSRSQSEADEQLAEEIFESQKRLDAPRTPPMVDVALFENSAFEFDSDEADSRDNSFLEALTDSPLPSHFNPGASMEAVSKHDRITPVSNQMQPAQQSLTICDNVNHSNASSCALDVKNSSAVQSNTVPLHEPNGAVLQHSDSHTRDNNKHFDTAELDPSVEAESSTQGESYFEITPKLPILPNDINAELTERVTSETPRTENNPPALVNETHLKQDSEYYHLSSK